MLFGNGFLDLNQIWTSKVETKKGQFEFSVMSSQGLYRLLTTSNKRRLNDWNGSFPVLHQTLILAAAKRRLSLKADVRRIYQRISQISEKAPSPGLARMLTVPGLWPRSPRVHGNGCLWPENGCTGTALKMIHLHKQSIFHLYDVYQCVLI